MQRSLMRAIDRRGLALLVATVCFLAACSAPAKNTAPPEDAFRAALDEATEHVPGAILYVSAPGLQFAEAAGVANTETGAPMRATSTLRLGSITKTFVSALTLISADRGELDLDATIDTYLKANVLALLPDGPMPTVRQLLNHTSGIPDYYSERFYFEDWKDRGPLETGMILRSLRGLERTGTPGEGFSYSNTNYHLVALILESVTGQRLESLLQTRLYEPLGLHQVWYGESTAPGDDISGYAELLGDVYVTTNWQENTGPDGGMFATASDLDTWLRALLSANGELASVGQQMQANPVTEGPRKLQGLGLEILQSRSGVLVLGHTGGLDGYLSAAFYIPEKDAVIVLHINKSDEEVLSRYLSTVLKTVMQL